MKINLAVWTAVNGYDWQPGSVYAPEDLVRYKDEIGTLDANNLPFGGVFLKDGNAVFWRVQIAPRMDSCGRGAVYCVVGAVPEDMAAKMDFRAVFASSEVSQPQKPFPAALDLPECTCEFKSPLGSKPLAERRFNGTETFSEIGGWCEEAKGGQLKIRITGTLDTPLFIVAYTPPPRRPAIEAAMPTATPPPRPAVHVESRASCPNPYVDQSTQRPSEPDSFMNVLAAFVYGFAFGVIVTVVCAWLVWPKNAKEQNAETTTQSSSDKSQKTIRMSSVGTSESTEKGASAVESATRADTLSPVAESSSGSVNSDSENEKKDIEVKEPQKPQGDDEIRNTNRKTSDTGKNRDGQKNSKKKMEPSRQREQSSPAKSKQTALIPSGWMPCHCIVRVLGVPAYGWDYTVFVREHEVQRRFSQW